MEPDEATILGYMDSLSNWGRWGADDQLGTLNFIDGKQRVRAAGLIRAGEAVSCANDVQTSVIRHGDPTPPQRHMLRTGQGLKDEFRVLPDHHEMPGIFEATRFANASEQVTHAVHGVSLTHVDALAHMFWDAKMYNGNPAELVTVEHGATTLDVRAAANGVFTRGVLLDLPLVKGTEHLDSGVGITPEDLEEAERKLGVEVGPGDVLLIRTAQRISESASAGGGPPRFTGLQAGALPWLRERDVAAIGSDGPNDAVPSGYRQIPIPVHTIGIVAMGLWIIDNLALEALAQAAKAHKRYEFCFVMSPVRFEGATGSLVNPVAIF